MGYRLPSGKMTTSPKVYIREWRKITNPINRFMKPFGLRVSGMDPGLAITTHGAWYRNPIDIPTDVAKALAAMIRRDEERS